MENVIIIGSADEKNITVEPSFKNYKKTRS
jgi:hypothetical protein